jgi:flagellar hook protein FlgE
MAGFDSLYTGITGLNSYQSWIDMISNNIANVDTTGFKGQRMTFADLFYQNQSFPSAPTNTNGGINGQQLGFGVKVNTVDTEFQQGGFQTTGLNTDLAINGDGFFILNNLTGSGTPTYTRDGAFSLNANGVLVDPATGLAVQGWVAKNGVVTPGGATGNINIPVGLSEQATATGAGTKVGPSTADSVFDVALGGNLDQTQWQQSFLNTVGAQSTNGTPFTVSTTMYDSLGNAHEATLTYTPDTAGATPANITAGGAGLVVTPDANIASGSILASDGTGTTITVTSNGPGLGYTLTDSSVPQNTATAADGQQNVTFDGVTLNMKTPAPAMPSVSTITVAAASNNLPADVENAAGTAVKPATRWAVSVSFTDGTTFSTISKAGSIAAGGAVTAATFNNNESSGTVGYAYFDQNGQFINSSSIETAANAGGITGAAVSNDIHTTGTDPSTLAGNELNITLWGTGVGNNASAPTGTGPAPTTGPIGLGYWQNASLAGSYTANVVSQNGYQAGTLDNITVGDDGSVTGAFTNGQQEVLAQVAMARFSNEGGLSRVGDNAFQQTANSGLAQVGAAGTGVFGSIQSGALEQSNVNLATEFTNLIVAQRAFEANTRGITTADQNLETVINLRASEN